MTNRKQEINERLQREFEICDKHILRINEALEDSPELLNEDAFANWIIKVQMSDESELEELMDAAAYQAICK